MTVAAVLVSICCPAQQSGMEVSEWNGAERYDFSFEGRDAILVRPKYAAEGNPWIFRPAFFDAFAYVDKALLERGWHIVYLDVTHCYGSPESVKIVRRFYKKIRREWHLSKKVVLEGLSRGGYFCFNWAAKYSKSVRSIYVDAPVCDITSWPSRFEKELWADFLRQWKVRDEDVTSDFKGNAIQLLRPISRAGIPIISVCGEADTVVPLKDNFSLVYDRYKSLGGTVELIIKSGCGHHPHSLEDPTPVIDFILSHISVR